MPGNFEDGLTEIWDFVNNSRRLYKTMKAAVADCERHARLWSQAVRCIGIRAVRELFGREPGAVPKWASTAIDQRILEMLLDTRPRGKKDYEYDEDDEIIETVVPEVEEKPKKRKARASKPSTDAPKKRKQRSDKGKPRGPRNPKGTP